MTLRSRTSRAGTLLLTLMLITPALVFGEAARLPVGALPGLVYPLMTPRLSSDYGPRRHPVRKAVGHHHGVDLAAPAGAPIRAVRAGVVVFADPYGGYGNLVVIRHEQGMTSHYGHCQKLRVRPGQRVGAGQVIATVGSTGISTGPHLHFEIRVDGKPLDPEQLIPGLAAEAAG